MADDAIFAREGYGMNPGESVVGLVKISGQLRSQVDASAYPGEVAGLEASADCAFAEALKLQLLGGF